MLQPESLFFCWELHLWVIWLKCLLKSHVGTPWSLSSQTQANRLSSLLCCKCIVWCLKAIHGQTKIIWRMVPIWQNLELRAWSSCVVTIFNWDPCFNHNEVLTDASGPDVTDSKFTISPPYSQGVQFHYLTRTWQRPQHGGAHFNVLIKNPAKAASPTLLSTNERPGSEAEGARARCDWLMLSVAPEFHHQPPDWSCQINRRGAFTG